MCSFATLNNSVAPRGDEEEPFSWHEVETKLEDDIPPFAKGKILG